MMLLVKQTHDNCSVWRGIARPNAFDVTSEAAVRTGVDSSFSCDVHIQQPERTELKFKISQDLHDDKVYITIHSHSLSSS